MTIPKTIVIKYGGNAMVNEELKSEIIDRIAQLKSHGYHIVLVHGGGPFINKILDKVALKSKFIGGHRKTTKEAMRYIEMALKGEVNTGLVGLMNAKGVKAVGISGKDAGLVTTKKRYHIEADSKVDLGQVADVDEVNPQILIDLINNGYLPVVACVAADKEGVSLNINADMMAGALAGALGAEYLVLTDVDGLRRDKDDPASLMSQIRMSEIPELMKNVIVGGMIPKIESCQIALNAGSPRARIINGTKPDMLLKIMNEEVEVGTVIRK